jgi:uncharacterized membrane protein YhaH (DUF805 family)
MNFTESVKICFSKYADFNGRALRSEYWWFVLFIMVGGLVLSTISSIIGMIFYLATLVPSLSAATRRLHDTDRSGWLQLIALIPVLGWLVVIYFLAQEGKGANRFGEPLDAPAVLAN